MVEDGTCPLFTDISVFTSLSGKLDPEEATAIMNECFDLLGGIVAVYLASRLKDAAPL